MIRWFETKWHKYSEISQGRLNVKNIKDKKNVSSEKNEHMMEIRPKNRRTNEKLHLCSQ